MRLVCATEWLDGLGGTETYLLTVADCLQELGHDVHVHATRLGRAAELARESGLRVVSGSGLPSECDAVLANFTAGAFDLAARYPAATLAYVCHSAQWHQQLPPQLPHTAAVTIALNDRIAAVLRSLGTPPQRLVRLRQPIDLMRFIPRRPPAQRARRLLILGNYTQPNRRELVFAACAEHGIEVVEAGSTSRTTERPEDDIDAADIVVGYGRGVLEAMACGRAAYVYGLRGGDGWVTGDSYPALEADGFAGTATGRTTTYETLVADLALYKPQMGIDNRDLVSHGHDVTQHAGALVSALLSAAPAEPGETPPLFELARLARVYGRAEMRTYSLRARIQELEGRIAELDEALEQLRGPGGAHVDGLLRFEQDLERRASELAAYDDALQVRDRELARVRDSRRYRVATALARPLHALRRR